MDMYNRVWRTIHQEAHDVHKRSKIHHYHTDMLRRLRQAKPFMMDQKCHHMIVDLCNNGVSKDAVVPDGMEGEDYAEKVLDQLLEGDEATREKHAADIGIFDSIRAIVDSARLPYERVWVEWQTGEERFDGSPQSAGWLLEQDPRDPTIWAGTCFVDHDEDEYKVKCWPIKIFLSCNANPIVLDNDNFIEGFRQIAYTGSNKINAADTTKMVLCRFDVWNEKLWAVKLASQEGVELLRSRSSWDFEAGWKITQNNFEEEDPIQVLEFVDSLFDNMLRDIRYLATFLATLNVMPIRIEKVPPPSGTFKGMERFTHYLQNNTVHLEIPNKLSFFTRTREHSEAETRKRHEVRGHFRHAARPVNENWTPFVNDKGRLVYRRWIDAFMRGDAEKGFVVKGYEVHSNQE